MKLLMKYKQKAIVIVLLLSIFTLSSIAFNNSVLAQTKAQQLGGVGYTIDQTFPDDNMAALIANKIGGGDVNHVITQSDIDNSTTWDDLGFEFIADITGVEYFVNLESLQLPFNNVSSLPQNFSNLTKLKYLDLSANLITELPSDFGNLSSLVNLWISENQLATFPDSFSSLSNLERLEADLNKITSLPVDFGNLSKLKVLFLTNNELTGLPESIGSLQALEVFRVNENQLNSIPTSIGGATNLKILWLNGNNLTEIPASIVNLNNLQNLAIGSNEIRKIPDDFDKLSSLIYFSFENNQLTSLPSNFKQLPALKTLRLYNNLLPSDIVSQLSQFTINSSSTPQDKLKLTSTTLNYTIKEQQDLEQLDYQSFLALKSVRELSNNHTYVLDDPRDEDGNAVNLSEYINNGEVVKSGKVLVKVRASGTGLFPNTSNNAVTTETIQLNFEITYFDLDFDLNGGTSEEPETQELVEGEFADPVEDPVRDGYIFEGWNTEEDGTGDYWDFLDDEMPESDVILYAQWEKIPEPANPSDPKPNPTLPTTGNISGTTGTNPNPTLPATGNTSGTIGLSALLAGSAIALIALFKRSKNMNSNRD